MACAVACAVQSVIVFFCCASKITLLFFVRLLWAVAEVISSQFLFVISTKKLLFPISLFSNNGMYCLGEGTAKLEERILKT